MTAEDNAGSAEPPNFGFGGFRLDVRFLEAVAALGFDTPSAVQRRAIPPLLDGRDVIGRARTGSGKTAAFGLPLLERVKEGGAARALVLAPTRELALQVGDALRSFAKRVEGLRVVTVYGGAPYPPQLKALRSGATVVVGTPGRTLDLFRRGSLDLSTVECVVLDEADEMLRMGFIDDVETLLAATPEERQVALFSATMPAAIQRVARKHLRDPIELQVEARAMTVEHIQQYAIVVPERHKVDALLRVLRGIALGTTLVFARTRARCAEVAEVLAKHRVAAEPLHGDLSQVARERVVRALRASRVRVVVATDVAARGIDVDHIGHVINLDLPPDPESYVHRIGRTARAGRAGTAVSLVTPRGMRLVERFRKALGVPIETISVPTDADLARGERGRLKTSLHEVADEVPLDTATELLQEAAGEGAHDVAQLAAAALYLLARERSVHLTPIADEEPPAWAKPPPPRKPRQRRHDGDRRVDEAFLYIPLGFIRGVRPGDIVGMLANEGQVSSADIGRITVLAHKSFVGLPRAVAERVLKAMPQTTLRGVVVKLAWARDREGFVKGERKPKRVGDKANEKPKHAKPKRSRDKAEEKPKRAKPKRSRDKAEEKPKRAKPKRVRDKAKGGKPKRGKPKRVRDKAKGGKPKRGKPKRASRKP